MSEQDIRDIRADFAKLTENVGFLAIKIAALETQQSTVRLLLKWVVTPLILVLAGLVGIKLVLPSS